MMKKAILQIILFISIGFTATAQVTVNVTADTNAMLIGDQVTLTLRMEMPSGYQYSWPTVADTLMQNVPVLSRSEVDTAVSEDKKTYTLTQRIRFTSFDSGFYMIPPMTFLYRNLPDTTVHTVLSEPVNIMVHTVAVDTTLPIKPIKGPMKIPLTFREILPWILAALGALILIGALIWYIRKRKKNQPVFQLRPRVQLKPEEQARMDLENLKAKKLWQNNRIKDYHSELTEILRRYIEARYGVMALEKTSAEILYELRSAGHADGKAMGKLEEILILADMVKFAKAAPLPDEHERSMQLAFEFVQETTPVVTTGSTTSQES